MMAVCVCVCGGVVVADGGVCGGVVVADGGVCGCVWVEGWGGWWLMMAVRVCVWGGGGG